MEEEIPQSRSGLFKLQGKPVQIDLFLKYERANEPAVEGKAGNDEFRPVKDEKIRVWLHPMIEEEWLEVDAISVEAYRSSRKRGASPEDANWKGNRAQECMQLYFCIRKGPDKEAERLFAEPVEVLTLDYIEVDRLIAAYNDAFIPTKEEIKNSLRERLGLGSLKESTSPNTSATPVSSSPAESGTRTPIMSIP